MGNFLDLSDLKTKRLFVVGNLLGNYDSLISLLYQQRFTVADTLITTGDMIDIAGEGKPIELLSFLKNTNNSYSVKGKNEVDMLRKCSKDIVDIPIWLQSYPKLPEIVKFLDELPSIIKISDYFYVVNSGVEPLRDINDQDPEVFYSIGNYDRDSRFYRFDNPEQKSWYEFNLYLDERAIKFCFSGIPLSDVNVPGGFCLATDVKGIKRCLVLSTETGASPVLINF